MLSSSAFASVPWDAVQAIAAVVGVVVTVALWWFSRPRQSGERAGVTVHSVTDGGNRSDVLSAKDAARLLGLNHNAVYGLAAKGELRPVPGSWPHKFRKAEVLAYMERSRLKPGDLRHLNQYAASREQGAEAQNV